MNKYCLSVRKFANKSLLSVVFLIATSVSLKIPKPVNTRPLIWLSSYSIVDSFGETVQDERLRVQDHFQNEFVTRNGSDYLISGDTSSVVFTCEATYPITLSFPFDEYLETTEYESLKWKAERISELSPDSPEPVSILFKSSFTINSVMLQFLSVNVSCSPVADMPEEMHTSIHIFLNGKVNIENEGDTLQISLEPSTQDPTTMSDEPPLVLPCRPASPDMKVSLEKEEISESVGTTNPSTLQKSWRALSISDNELSFDPKVGFTLHRGLLGDRVFGLYRCSVLFDSADDSKTVSGDDEVANRDFVYLNVTKSTSSDASEGSDHQEVKTFEPRSVFRGKASARLEYLYANNFPETFIRCCTGVENKPPMLYSGHCTNPMECEWLKEIILEEVESESESERKATSNPQHEEGLTNVSSDCVRNAIFGISRIVVCKGENLDYAEQFIDMFHPLAGGPVENRSIKIQEANDALNGLGNQSASADQVISLSQFETIANAETAAVAQKMIILVGKHIRKRKPYGLPILFDIQLRELIYDSDEFVDLNDKTMIEKKLERAASTIVKEYDRDTYYEGEPMVFMCLGQRFFYTREPRLRLNWENGSKTLLDTVAKESEAAIRTLGGRKERRWVYLSGNGDMFVGNGDLAVFVFGKEVIAKQGVHSVDCWMPKRDSDKWDKISKKVKVLPSAAPKFAEKLDETVYFYLGDIGNVITCTVVGGLPQPYLRATRDNQRMKRIKLNVTRNPEGSIDSQKHSTKETVSVGRNNLTATLKIRFPIIRHEHQCVLQCTAKNINSTVVRIVRVFVIERSGKALVISLSIVGILCTLFLGLGAKYWRDKNNSLNK